MGVDRPDALVSLMRSAHQLGRIAAREAGDRTPAAHWRTLALLRTDGPMRIGELAAAGRVSQPGMTRMLASLVGDGLVVRVSDHADSRAAVIRLTPAGRAAIDRWHSLVGATLAPHFVELNDADWSALIRTAELLERSTRPLVAAR